MNQKCLLPIMLIGLLFFVGAVSAATPWYNAGYGNRININITSFRANDTVEVNMSLYGICSNKNCTDVIVVDQNNVELILPNGKKAWQVPLDNITSKNKPKNDFVVFVPQNNSLIYWIYWNNTLVNNVGGSIYLWEDNFERYNVGMLAQKTTTNGGATENTNGTVCLTSGQKGVCLKSGGFNVEWNITEYTDITIQWELNSTSGTTNENLFTLGPYGSPNHYRIPQENGANTYQINRNTGADGYVGSTIVTSLTGPLNFTSQRNSNSFNFWLNHTLRGGNYSDGTPLFTSNSRIFFGPGMTTKSLLSLRVWNLSVFTYSSMATFSNGSVEGNASFGGGSGTPSWTPTDVYCYREFANQSTACGGLSSGTYEPSGWFGIPDWTDGVNGNWNDFTTSYDANIYINYTKPQFSTNQSLWQIRDNITNDNRINLSIPIDCWNYGNQLKLAVKMFDYGGGPTHNVTWYCFKDATNIINIRSTAPLNGFVFEEAMYWNILTNYTINVSYSTTIGELSQQTIDTIFTMNPQEQTQFASLPPVFYLNYNGTIYNSTFVSSPDSSTYYYSTIIEGKPTGTYNFSVFTIQSNNITISSTTYSQSITAWSVSDCSVDYTILNFTIYDEENIALRVNALFELTINASLSTNLAASRKFNFSGSGKSNYVFCIFPNSTTIYANSMYVQFENQTQGYTYKPRNYFAFNSYLTNYTQNIDLYLLNYSATLAKIFISDLTTRPVLGVQLLFQRNYLGQGTYTTVTQALSDDSGYAVTYLRPNDIFYQIIAIKDGQILKSFVPQKFVPNSAGIISYSYILDSGSGSEYFDFLNRGFAYDCVFSNATKILRCTAVDTTGIARTVHLNVDKLQIGGAWTSVCNQQASSVAAIMTCTLNETSNNEIYRYSFYVNPRGSELLLRSGYMEFKGIPLAGLDGVFLAFLMFILFATIGIFNPVVSMVLSGVSLLISVWLNFIFIPTASLVSFFAVIAILVWRMKRA